MRLLTASLTLALACAPAAAVGQVTTAAASRPAAAPLPAPVPGRLMVQAIDTVDNHLLEWMRITVREIGPAGRTVVENLRGGSLATFNSVPSGNVEVRTVAVGFVPRTDTVAFNAAAGIVVRYPMQRARVRVNNVVVRPRE